MAKKRRFPFGFGFDEDFGNIFEEMEKRMEESMKGFEDMDWEKIEPGKNSFGNRRYGSALATSLLGSLGPRQYGPSGQARSGYSMSFFSRIRLYWLCFAPS